MPRVKLILEFEGTSYCGWQRQVNDVAVQQKLEEAIERTFRHPAKVYGSSRTDSGVHSKGLVAAFDTHIVIEPERYALAINSRLPKDITVRHSEIAPDDFNPRYGATLKLYRYSIINSPIRPALSRNFVWYIRRPLDVDLMKIAAKHFVGTHDFTSFCNHACNTEDANNTRSVTRCDIIIDGDRIDVEVEGKSFLYNMVRSIVGMLVDVGMGHFKPDDIPEIFKKRSRESAGVGAPAKGLCLEWVKY